MATWTEVLNAILAGPRLPIYGTIREVRREKDHPTWAAVRGGCRVWRHGQRLRVESSGGIPIYITDGIQAWDFSKSPGRPVTGPPSSVRYFGQYQFELGTRTAEDWKIDEFTKPIGPVAEDDFAGRRCWTTQLAPPRRKPHPIRIWVDIDSGQMLGTRGEEFGEGTQFTDLVIGEEIDDTQFEWVGPTMTPEQQDEMLRDHHREREQEQAAWSPPTSPPPPARPGPARFHADESVAPRIRHGCFRHDERQNHAISPLPQRRRLGTTMGRCPA